MKQKVWWKEKEYEPIGGLKGDNRSSPKAPPGNWITKRKEYNYLYDKAGNRVIVDDDSPNLIENKGFEKGNLDHWLQWSSDGILDWEITSDYSQEGMYCLYSPYFSSSGTSECAMQYFSLSDFDKPFNASCWVKTENLTGGVRIDVTFWNSDWTEGYGQKSSSTTTGTNDWRNIGLVVNESDIPEQAVNCKVIVRRIQGSGELWVDNVRCEEGKFRTPEKRYIYAGRRLMGMEKDGAVYFHHLDRVGSPVIVTDRNGNMKRGYTYEAFGNINAHSGGLDDDLRFTSKEQDGTGLHYFGARYYNADWGRFLTPDPHSLNPGNLNLTDPQSLNPYAYCRNNPLIFYDPDGLDWRRVEDNTIIYFESEIIEMALETAYKAQMAKTYEEYPKIPFYFSQLSEGPEFTQRGLTESIFNYGKMKKTVEGYSYQLLQVQGWGTKDVPVWKGEFRFLGKTKKGRKVIGLKLGGTKIKDDKVEKGVDMIIRLMGTMDELNDFLKEYNYRIIEKDEEYILEEIEKEER